LVSYSNNFVLVRTSMEILFIWDLYRFESMKHWIFFVITWCT
jgi:hypothetical protein